MLAESAAVYKTHHTQMLNRTAGYSATFFLRFSVFLVFRSETGAVSVPRLLCCRSAAVLAAAPHPRTLLLTVHSFLAASCMCC